MEEKLVGFQLTFNDDSKIRVKSNNDRVGAFCKSLMEGKYETGMEIDHETADYISGVTEVYAIYSGDNLKKIDQPDRYLIFHIVGLVLASYDNFRHLNPE